MKAISFIALSVLTSIALAPNAEAAKKAGDIEYTVGIVRSFSDSISGNRGSSLDLSSRTGFQLGMDYSVTNKVAVGVDMTWLRPRYSARLVPDDGSAPIEADYRASIFSGQVNGSYSFIDGPISPYVEAGLGWTHFDSNISDSSPITGCWWDPWWGYVCDTFYSTYRDTTFSYGAAAGVRWDFRRGMFLKAGYRWLEVETDSAVDKPVLEQASLEIGWRF